MPWFSLPSGRLSDALVSRARSRPRRRPGPSRPRARRSAPASGSLKTPARRRSTTTPMSSTVCSIEVRTVSTAMTTAEASTSVRSVSASRPLRRNVLRSESAIGRGSPRISPSTRSTSPWPKLAETPVARQRRAPRSCARRGGPGTRPRASGTSEPDRDLDRDHVRGRRGVGDAEVQETGRVLGEPLPGPQRERHADEHREHAVDRRRASGTCP